VKTLDLENNQDFLRAQAGDTAWQRLTRTFGLGGKSAPQTPGQKADNGKLLVVKDVASPTSSNDLAEATRLEPYTFGVTWERGPVTLQLLAPFTRAITAHSWAWTAGTHGKAVAGPVVLVDLSTPDSLAAYKAQVRGAWVLPRSSYPLWNPDGPPMSADDSIQMAERLRLRNQASADTSAPAVLARRQFSIDLPYVLKSAGALGTLVDGSKEQALTLKCKQIFLLLTVSS